MQITDTLSYIWRHPANRGRRGTALARAIGWQIFKRASGRPWDISIAGNIKLRCHPDSTSASAALYCNGRPDYHEMGFMLDYLKPGDRFVDIGANVGVYALLAASVVGEHGAVDAYEPDARAAARLRENVRLNGLKTVTIRQAAVSAHDGTVTFSMDQDTTNRILGKEHTACATTTVSCSRLDTLYPDGDLAMVKMDIEVAEPLALSGGAGLLARSDPKVWLLELTGLLHNFGYTEKGLADWLGERGYDLGLYDADMHELRIGGEPWKMRDNVLAISRRHRDEVMNRCGATLVLLG